MTSEEIDLVAEKTYALMKTDLDEIKESIEDSNKDVKNFMLRDFRRFFMDKLLKKLRFLFKQKLSSSDVAPLLGISVKALNKRCERGTIPAHKEDVNDPGSSWYFLRDELMPYLTVSSVSDESND